MRTYTWEQDFECSPWELPLVCPLYTAGHLVGSVVKPPAAVHRLNYPFQTVSYQDRQKLILTQLVFQMVTHLVCGETTPSQNQQ